MIRATRRQSKALPLKSTALLLAAMWISAIVVMFILHFLELRENILNLASIQAADSFEKDLVYRRWAAAHGGVYVPLTEQTPPNPYLAHIKDRDITSTSGLQLTLVNPAYMTRQVQELGREQYGHQGHITSLNPLRPENAADSWETRALQAFQLGASEVVELSMIDGKEYLRLMRPMVTEEPCLKCHAVQGYKVGDLRGGVSVSILMTPLQQEARRHMTLVAGNYLFVLLAGLAGLWFAVRRLKILISKHEKAERELTKSEAYLTGTSKMARLGGWEVDLDKQAVFWTEGTYQIHEVPSGQEIKLDEAINFYHADDRETIRKKIQAAIEHGEPFDVELRLITASGRQIWVRALCTPEPVEGKRSRLNGTFQDITERVQAEYLGDLNTQLASKNRELEQLVHVVSHDLRSPLISIEGFNGLLATSLTELATSLEQEALPEEFLLKVRRFLDESRNSIEYVDKSAAKMNALLKGLLQVSRLGSVEIEFLPLDMNQLMAEVISCFKFQAEQQGACIETGELPACLGDSGQINQLFSNLVGNALKYADPARPCVIKISGVREGLLATYCVEDNGLGIAAESQDKVFRMFQQLNPGSQGEGLGLSIVQKIAERNHGRVWLESEFGRGSRFYVSLPHP